MFDAIRSFLTDESRSRRQSENLPDEQVALCAILVEVAEADRDFDPEEYKEIILQLRGHFSLETAEAEKLIELTQQERDKSTDLWPFTRMIGQTYSVEQKAEVLTMVWQVILADERLDPYEEQLARRLQTMLSVNQSVLMSAKEKARKDRKARGPAKA